MGRLRSPDKPEALSVAAQFLYALFARISSDVRMTFPAHDDPALAQSQVGVLSRQIPLLFVILTVNALALAATHIRSAPPFLTIVMPVVFCLIGFYRVRFWLKLDLSDIDDAGILRLMKTVMVNVTVLGAVFTVWALSLFRYGGPYAKCHVAFYMAITVISCILCLTHLRRAAWLLIAVVVAPYAVFFLHTGNMVLMAMAANLVLVAGSLMIVMLSNHKDFAGRVIAQRETRRLLDENLRLANLDSLTGLPNRRCFLAALDNALAGIQREHGQFAVAIIDLDGFKSVNDTYGHAAGDRLLAAVGERLRGIADPTTFIARLGGDEFGAILRTVTSEADIAAFGARIQALLHPAFAIGKDGITTIECSIGAALYPQSGETAEDLFEYADYALYHSKQHRKGETVVFSPALETHIRRSSQIEQALRSADLERELSLAFHPIMDLRTNDIFSLEAHAHWTSGDLGRVAKADFIPVAEHTQLINRITEIVFAKTLAALKTWPDAPTVTFDLSAHDLYSPATIAKLRAMIAESGIHPARIMFEITESALRQNFDLAADAIAGLQSLGCRIALDDFCANVFSLGDVHRLKLDKIKIGKKFVADLEQNDIAPKVIGAILHLCRNLDLDCIIEGVETNAQLTILRNLAAPLASGPLFGCSERCGSVSKARSSAPGPR